MASFGFHETKGKLVRIGLIYGCSVYENETFGHASTKNDGERSFEP